VFSIRTSFGRWQKLQITMIKFQIKPKTQNTIPARCCTFASGSKFKFVYLGFEYLKIGIFLDFIFLVFGISGLFRLGMILLVCFSCSGNSTPGRDKLIHGLPLSEISPKYATGFKVFDGSHYQVLEIFVPWDSINAVQRFYLLGDNPDNVTIPKDGVTLSIPLENMACFSATHLSFAHALGLIGRIVGVSSTDFVVSEEFQHLVGSGKIKEVGIGGHFNLEKLIQLNPQIIMISPQKGQTFDPLINAGLNIVMNGDYLEHSPLGRAEWIKMMGLLFGKEGEAMQIFDSISSKYETLKNLTKNIGTRPVVLSGKQYSGFWSLPGGKSYVSQFISDAGGTYLFADNPETGGLTLDFEAVYAKGLKADFWRFLIYSQDEFTSGAFLTEDPRYADFFAFKNKKVFVCNTFKTPYFQKGLLEPQIILADYIKILHPKILPQHQNVYYHLLP